MTVRDILHRLEQVYGTKLSHEQVPRITGQVPEEVRAWQDRPLDPVYAAAFPAAVVQRCVVHLVRNALRPAARRDAAAVAAQLRTTCTAPSEEAALEALAAFTASGPGRKYPR